MPGLKSFWIKSPESENMPETRQTKHFFTFGTEEEQVILLPELLIVGHSSIDHIKNANGERTQPGGAAIYAAMGAKTVCKDVGILTAVGSDYSFWNTLNSFSPNMVKRVSGKSSRFIISYDKNWNAHYRTSDIGPGSRITTEDVVKAAQWGAKMVHLAPMNPPKVVRMVKALRESKGDVTISVNSCISYLDDTTNKRRVLDAANMADIFILNEKELRAITGKEVTMAAVNSIKTRTLVLTLGEIGTIVRSDGVAEFVPAMAAITKKAVDVTGAGDTWSGSFLASLLRTGSWIRAVSIASVVSAIKCTGWNFEKIEGLNFDNINDVYDFIVSLKEKGRQLTLSASLRGAPA